MGAGDKTYKVETILTQETPSRVLLVDEDGETYIVDEQERHIILEMDSGLHEYDVPVYSDGNVPGLVGERSYRYVVCGFAYKESDVRLFRGKPYCMPNGCHNDIKSILFEENMKRINRRTAGPEKVSHFYEGE